MRDANPKTTYLKDYTPPDYLIDAVDLHCSLDEEETHVRARLTMRKNPDAPKGPAPLELVGEDLLLESLRLDGRALTPAQYQLNEAALVVPSVPSDRTFVVETETRINPNANTALEGLYLSNGLLCTQCEAEGFRKITYFLDRPDVMARYTTTLSADKTRFPVLLSNGNKVGEGELENNRHWVKWSDPYKKPSYLFALVAGRLECLADTYTTVSGRTIDLQIYVEPRDLDKCGHAMQSLKNAMAWDEAVYGREYDLDLYMIVAVGHFNMGAMENKGLNIFNTKYVLARPDTATDIDYEQIEGVIGHEYFHNWTGNRITCRDWFQLSLKEGLTVFRDQEFTADRTSRAVKRITDVNLLRTRQFPEDAGPLAHPVRPDSYIEINNFYTATVYEKGAEVVRMIHTLLGSEGFRKGIDLYFERYDGKAVTTDDFVKAMEEANQVDLTQFRRWYSQAGTPELAVEAEYDPAACRLTLTVHQHCPPTPGQPEKAPYHMPLTLGLIAPDGSDLPVRLQGEAGAALQKVLHLTERRQQFRLIDLPEKPVVSILRGFSAPVKLQIQRGLEQLAFLLSHDSDPFNRWEAGQQLASRIILQRVERIQSSATPGPVDERLINAFRAVVGQGGEDLSYLALLVTLPSESYLGELMAVIDVEAIHQARQQTRLALAEALREEWESLYHRHHRNEPARFDAAAIGRRALKNVALAYLVELAEPVIDALCERQFHEARTMTDQLAALSVMVNSRHPGKADCLSAFYEQWREEALVIDKWFALQATSFMPGATAVVEKLLDHPAFDLCNPNRVRALVGAFSQANALHFHAADGGGYRFLGDRIIALDRINPQLAARLLSPFSHWRRYDESPRRLMKQQLERIIGTETISKDVYEVATKSLV
jgi:aminopeptidase N